MAARNLSSSGRTSLRAVAVPIDLKKFRLAEARDTQRRRRGSHGHPKTRPHKYKPRHHKTRPRQTPRQIKRAGATHTNARKTQNTHEGKRRGTRKIMGSAAMLKRPLPQPRPLRPRPLTGPPFSPLRRSLRDLTGGSAAGPLPLPPRPSAWPRCGLRPRSPAG